MHEIAGALGAVVVGLLVVPAAVELLQQYRHGALERPELRCACGRMGTSDRCRPLSRSGMSDELHAAKVAEAQEAYEEDLEEWGFWRASIERMREEYVAEKRAYEQGLAGVARSLVAYGQIPALAAVMGGLEVEVTIRPTGEGMLPGFVEQLLGLPAPTVATEEAAGGD